MIKFKTRTGSLSCLNHQNKRRLGHHPAVLNVLLANVCDTEGVFSWLARASPDSEQHAHSMS